MTEADFAETIGLCQFLPGPNIGNASIVVGKRWFGLRGSLVAFLGLFALPFVWVLALFALYADFAATNPTLRAIVTGVGAAGAGLFIGTAIKLGRVLARKPAALAIIAACFIAAGVARMSLFIVLPIAELYVIIKVGEAIGILPTLALLLVDGFVGAALARSQGRTAWRRFPTPAPASECCPS